MKTLFTALLLSVLISPAFSAGYKYEKIDSVNLVKDAKAVLKQKYPSLTQHDIELLYGFVAVRMYNDERGISNDYL